MWTTCCMTRDIRDFSLITLSFYEIIKWKQVFYEKTSLLLPSFWKIVPSYRTITPEISGVFSSVSRASSHGITQRVVAYASATIQDIHSTYEAITSVALSPVFGLMRWWWFPHFLRVHALQARNPSSRICVPIISSDANGLSSPTFHPPRP